MTSPAKPAANDKFVRGRPSVGVLNRHSLSLVVGAGLLVLLVLSQLGENGIVSWFNLRARHTQLQEDVARLEEENEALRARLDALATDPEALEKIAREKYNMRREGEEVLIVIPREKLAERNGDH
jgi:cell division protein FtsB